MCLNTILGKVISIIIIVAIPAITCSINYYFYAKVKGGRKYKNRLIASAVILSVVWVIACLTFLASPICN
ncbi:hypothetical protein H6503_05115 [Candidatus Woesearchaeota archaeon]|nr:hypothetical protein [Candidatus Woesearchaeota archaeon]